MIQPKELRRGNFIKCLGKIYEVDGMDDISVDFKVDGAGMGATYRSLDPIPLTPEILEKAEFKKVMDGWDSKQCVNFGISNIERGAVCPFWNNIRSGNEIRYLHHLQNMFFASTGEELSIQL